MKKLLTRILVVTILGGSMPTFADDDNGSSGGGGGGGGGSGAAIGIAVGGAALVGLIGYLIYKSSKDKDRALPKAEDPFAPQPNETTSAVTSPAQPSALPSGGIGSNQKLEF